MDGIDGLKAFIVAHRNQLESSGVPDLYWETLYKKLKDGVFDAGEYFTLAKVDQEEDDKTEIHPFNQWKVFSTCEIKAQDIKHIYLVDHAWTFRPNQVRPHLSSIPGLLKRMCDLMNVPFDDETDIQNAIRDVMKETWKYSQTYSIGNQNLDIEERLPVWYIIDEFGARIQHSQDPSTRLVPFFYLNEQASYSLLFPLRDLKENEEVTRDFVEGSGVDVVHQAALAFPWSSEFSDKYLQYMSFEQIEPKAEYFAGSRLNETFPSKNVTIPALPVDRKIRTYVEYTFIREFLKHPRFELVDDPEIADVWWLSSHFKDFKELSEQFPHRRINQFPCEHILTVKDLICVVARRAKEIPRVNEETMMTEPSWLPTTFNLKTELAQFIAFFLAKKAKGLPNYWIIKPFNLARSLDTHITDNLDFILRLAVSGPKVCQQYISRPVIFYREDLAQKVKFDIRYIVLLSSVEPVKAYAYRRFWLRFANKPFELNNFDEYERHFTVMNYSANNLHQMFCHDFIRLFEEQNPNQSWSDIEKQIFSMLGQLFRAATKGDPPSSLVPNPQSRALYGVDLMLSWSDSQSGGKVESRITPQLLELNWAPDCKRACVYYPEFYDDVFSVLFLDEDNDKFQLL